MHKHLPTHTHIYTYTQARKECAKHPFFIYLRVNIDSHLITHWIWPIISIEYSSNNISWSQKSKKGEEEEVYF